MPEDKVFMDAVAEYLHQHPHNEDATEEEIDATHQHAVEFAKAEKMKFRTTSQAPESER